LANVTFRLVVIGITFSLLATMGCGKDSPTAPTVPTQPPPPQFPSVLGTYQSSRFLVSTATHLETGTAVQLECEGQLTISSQNGSQYSGSFIRRTCRSGGQIVSTDVRSGTLSGTVRTDGGTNMGLFAPGAPTLLAGLASLGCAILSSSTEYNGAFAGANVTVSASVTASCSTVPGTWLINQTISGNR
jgi:hypothetical protein